MVKKVVVLFSLMSLILINNAFAKKYYGTVYNDDGERENILVLANSYIDIAPLSRYALQEVLKINGYDYEKIKWAIFNCKADWKVQAEKCARKYIEIRNKNNFYVSRDNFKKQLEEHEGFSEIEAAYGVEMAYTTGHVVDTSERALLYEIELVSDKYLYEMIHDITGIELKEKEFIPAIPLEKRSEKIIKIVNVLQKSCPYLSEKLFRASLHSFGYTQDEINAVINIPEWSKQALRFVKFIKLNNPNYFDDSIESIITGYSFNESQIKFALKHLQESLSDDSVELFDNAILLNDLIALGLNQSIAQRIIENRMIYYTIDTMSKPEVDEMGRADIMEANNPISEKEQKIIDTISGILEEQPLSKEKVMFTLNTTYGISLEDIEMALLKTSIDWGQEAIKYAKNLKEKGLNKRFAEEELYNQKFTPKEVEEAILDVYQ